MSIYSQIILLYVLHYYTRIFLRSYVNNENLNNKPNNIFATSLDQMDHSLGLKEVAQLLVSAGLPAHSLTCATQSNDSSQSHIVYGIALDSQLTFLLLLTNITMAA